MVLGKTPTVQLEKWDGSEFTVSVTATSETIALMRAERWVDRNVARQMQPKGKKPERVVQNIMSGVGPVSKYYFRFQLKRSK